MKTMKTNLWLWATALTLSACGSDEKKPSPPPQTPSPTQEQKDSSNQARMEGNWLLQESWTMLGADTVFQTKPQVLNIESPLMLNVSDIKSIDSGTDVRVQIKGASWELKNDSLHFALPDSLAEAWALLHLSDSELLLLSQKNRSAQYRKYLRLPKQESSDEFLNAQIKFWSGGKYRVQAPSHYPESRFAQYPIRLKNNRYAFEGVSPKEQNARQADFFFLTGNSFLYMEGLTDNQGTPCLVVIDSIEGNTLRGRYSYRNQMQNISIEKL